MAKVLITGSNRGIGLAMTQKLVSRGDEVIAVCRQSSESLNSLQREFEGRVRVEEGVDVTSASSLRSLASKLGDMRIDVLINNAGVMKRSSLDALDIESMKMQYEVNAIGPLQVTSVLIDKLSMGSKVAFITSRMGSIADNSSGGSYGYRMSKAALNAGSVSLAHDLRPRGIAVAILHPGYVKTDMTSHSGNITPAESAQGLLDRIDELNLENSGTFWHTNGEVLPW